MSDDRGVTSPPVGQVEGGTGFHAKTDWIMAILVMGAAVAAVAYPVLYLRMRLVFDLDDPDFNPAVFLPVFLFVFGLKYLIAALRGSLLGRRFGESVVQFDRGVATPGEPLRGVIRCPVHFVPTGDYEIRLRCVRKTGSGGKARDSIREEQTMLVSPQFADPRKGIPFAFMIPAGAPSTTVAGTSALDLLGDSSGEVRWILEVKAPLKGLDYYAIFGVHVRPRPANAA